MPAILSRDLSPGATWTSPHGVDSLPLSNLRDPQPRVRARLQNETVVLVADFGATVPVDCATLISTTLPADATVRFRLSDTDPTGTAGEAWDTGTLDAVTRGDWQGNVVLLRTAGPAMGRYARWTIRIFAQAFVDIGLAPVGALDRYTYGHAFGIEEGRLILDQRQRNVLTGAEFVSPAITNPRTIAAQMPSILTPEARGQFRDMVARIGGAGDILFVPDLGLSQAELNARCLWGSPARPGQTFGTAHRALPVHAATLAIVARS